MKPLIIELYAPDNNPVADTNPGWLASSQDHKEFPRSSNAPTPELAIRKLLRQLQKLGTLAKPPKPKPTHSYEKVYKYGWTIKPPERLADTYPDFGSYDYPERAWEVAAAEVYGVVGSRNSYLAEFGSPSDAIRKLKRRKFQLCKTETLVGKIRHKIPTGDSPRKAKRRP